MDPNTNTPQPNEQLPPAGAPPPASPLPGGPAVPAIPSLPAQDSTQPQVVVSPEVDPVAPVVSGGPAPAAGTVVSGGFSSPGEYSAPPVSPGALDTSQAPVYGGSFDSPTPPPPSKPRSLKMLLVALAAVVVLGAGSAAAYFGVIVPNQPANVLKTALENSLQQKQASFNGTSEASSGGLAIKANMSGATDTVAKTADLQLNLTVSGVSFPVEARLVNKNVYVKVGDLSTITGLVSAFSPSTGSAVQTLSSQLSNKWIVIDSTLVDESGAGCVLDTNWNFTKADIQLLETQYNKDPFVTIQSTSSDPVDGQSAEKFVLSIDDDKATAYGNAKTLYNLSIVKALTKCTKSGAATPSTSKATGDHGKTPITVWVDKSTKRIVKIAFQDSNATLKKSGASASFTATISYKPVSITAPANAEPAIQVFTDIQKSIASDPALSSLLGGGSGLAQ